LLIDNPFLPSNRRRISVADEVVIANSCGISSKSIKCLIQMFHTLIGIATLTPRGPLNTNATPSWLQFEPMTKRKGKNPPLQPHRISHIPVYVHRESFRLKTPRPAEMASCSPTGPDPAHASLLYMPYVDGERLLKRFSALGRRAQLTSVTISSFRRLDHQPIQFRFESNNLRSIVHRME
jgi:hypothetical protein